MRTARFKRRSPGGGGAWRQPVLLSDLHRSRARRYDDPRLRPRRRPGRGRRITARPRMELTDRQTSRARRLGHAKSLSVTPEYLITRKIRDGATWDYHLTHRTRSPVAQSVSPHSSKAPGGVAKEHKACTLTHQLAGVVSADRSIQPLGTPSSRCCWLVLLRLPTSACRASSAYPPPWPLQRVATAIAWSFTMAGPPSCSADKVTAATPPRVLADQRGSDQGPTGEAEGRGYRTGPPTPTRLGWRGRAGWLGR